MRLRQSNSSQKAPAVAPATRRVQSHSARCSGARGIEVSILAHAHALCMYMVAWKVMWFMVDVQLRWFRQISTSTNDVGPFHGEYGLQLSTAACQRPSRTPADLRHAISAATSSGGPPAAYPARCWVSGVCRRGARHCCTEIQIAAPAIREQMFGHAHLVALDF